jgi:hypothetical protein
MEVRVLEEQAGNQEEQVFNQHLILQILQFLRSMEILAEATLVLLIRLGAQVVAPAVQVQSARFQ